MHTLAACTHFVVIDYQIGLSDKKSNLPQIKLYNHSYFDNFSLQLISAGQGRKSTDVLKSLQLDKRICLYEDVDAGDKFIQSGDYDELNSLVLEAWIKKKKTSSLIANSDILKIEAKLEHLMNMKIYFHQGGALRLVCL